VSNKIPFQLSLGSILLLIVLFLAAAGPFLAPYPRGYSENFVTLDTGNGPELFVSPLEPSSRHLLGTDNWGYDILSLMLYGASFSVLLCLGVSLIRVVLGASLGLVWGLQGSLERGFVGGGETHDGGRDALSRHFSGVAGSIPAFIMIYFILFGINFNSPLGLWPMAFVQGLLMVIFGIPQTASAVHERVAQLRKEPFMESGIVGGAGKGRLTLYYILPFLKETLLVLFSQETVAVLTLMGQLGVFHIFMGGTLLTYSPIEYHSLSHEWAGLVGQYRNLLQGDAWWVLFFPLVGYLFLLFSFYIFSRGLEEAVNRSYRKGSGRL